DVDELCGDAQARSRTADASLDDALHVQLLDDIVQIDVRTLERISRATRGDAESFDFGKSARQLVGHAVGEVLLRRVTADVCERQYGYGRASRGVRGDNWHDRGATRSSVPVGPDRNADGNS